MRIICVSLQQLEKAIKSKEFKSKMIAQWKLSHPDTNDADQSVLKQVFKQVKLTKQSVGLDCFIIHKTVKHPPWKLSSVSVHLLRSLVRAYAGARILICEIRMKESSTANPARVPEATIVTAPLKTSVDCPQCLLKGSVTAERPRTLRRLRNVYGPSACGMGAGGDGGGGERLEDGEVSFRSERDRERDEKSLSIMSPFDEQEEWAKISEIMASFGTGLVRESVFVTELEKEFQTRLGLSSDTSSSPIVSTSVGQWLSTLGLADYENLFINYGFDDLDFINGVLDETDLKDMEITSDQERAVILDAVGLLNKRVDKRGSGGNGQSVDEWLKSIHLENYAETFRKNLYTDMERVRCVWEVELATVLEIKKPAHRKRILASVSGSSAHAQNRNCTGPNLEDLNKDLKTLKVLFQVATYVTMYLVCLMKKSAASSSQHLFLLDTHDGWQCLLNLEKTTLLVSFSKTNIQQLKDDIRENLPETTAEGNGGTSITGTNSTGTSTLRHRKNRPAPQPPQRPSSHNGAISAPEQLEIRAPSELLLGVPSTLKTQWRHQPKALVTGCVTYVANIQVQRTVTLEKYHSGHENKRTSCYSSNYAELGSLISKPNPHRTESLVSSVKLNRHFQTANELNSTVRMLRIVANPKTLVWRQKSPGAKGTVVYVTSNVLSTIPESLPAAKNQRSEERVLQDQATEVILTLGQAFEVAYQMALRDKLGGHTVRSQSANQLTTFAKSSKVPPVSPDSVLLDVGRESLDQPTAIVPVANSTMSQKPKPRFKSFIPHLVAATANLTQDANSNSSSLSGGTVNCTSSGSSSNPATSPSANSVSSSNSNASTNQCTTKPLVTHGRSHSVNDIKVNGNQLKLAPAPVDDIGIGVKDMKPGSRAPIALSEEFILDRQVFRSFRRETTDLTVAQKQRVERFDVSTILQTSNKTQYADIESTECTYRSPSQLVVTVYSQEYSSYIVGKHVEVD
ncbi:Ankyrin repeat and sterile alpha motif domain-containing protein 1B [Melipona quadrifasciata]|uniref:Ankyrin repeat and sterile alpha motif domain-containing protein 1B n=1 Tax=Melipona quadrifasciata TaxID=166423 RepID=A0A0N0U4D7_9HYME|nr:Ankyrin repeat and sterile alpha motif domain-containing protein 1B [Melipona quadrifasciata]